MNIVHSEGVMTAKELENFLYKLDWSNKESSINLGVSERNVYYWLSGKRKIPLYIEKSVMVNLKLKEAMNNVHSD